MRSATRLASSTLLAVVLAAAPRAQGALWVVDAGGGPGADFPDVQPAVDAAAEGDTILVRDGTYSSFAVVAQSLRIVGEAGSDPLVQEPSEPGAFGPQADAYTSVRVEDLAAGQRVLLRGLRIEPVPVDNLALAGVPPPPGLSVVDCLGSVWIEDVEVAGNAKAPLFAAVTSGDVKSSGASVVAGASVHLTRLSARGAPRLRALLTGEEGHPPDHGIRIESSVVDLYDCVLAGGVALGSTCSGFGMIPGTLGCDGARVEGSVVFASGTSFVGGDGGVGCDYDGGLPGSPGEGGDGGDGLHVADGESSVAWLDCTFVAGEGAEPNGTAPGGEDGVAVNDPFGAVTGLAGTSRSYSIETPVQEATKATLELLAGEGELFVLWFSQDVLGLYVPALSGVWLPGLAGQPAFLGVVPAGGVLEVEAPVGSLPPGVGATFFYTQAIVGTPLGSIVLGSGSALVIVDETVAAG